jgi:photosystem II stability/assembly factor-like uncharacterized protein
VAGGSAVVNSSYMFLPTPGDATTFWETGNHNGDSLFVTTDSGKTFTSVGKSMLPNGLDALSVDFSDPAHKNMVVGPHEIASSLWHSTDSGATWQNVGQSLPSGTFCTAPVVVNPMTYLVGCSNNELYKTTNAGTAWNKVSTSAINRPGLLASDQSIYWVGKALLQSTNAGDTWTQLLDGNTVQSVPPIELPGGKVAVVGSAGILVSGDHGKSWTRVTAALSNTPWTFTYSVPEKAFFTVYGVCDSTNVIHDDTVMKCAYDSTM